MKRTLALMLLPVLGLALAGCMRFQEARHDTVRYIVTGHPGGAYEPREATRHDLENRASFVLLDRRTQRSVTVSRIQERTLEDGRLEVVANVRNRENRRIQVQINCVFKNEHGISTGDETPFQTLILTENAQESVRFVSMNDQARWYTMRVRQAR